MPLTPEQEQAVRLISADEKLMAHPGVRAEIDRVRQTHMVAPAKAEAAKAKSDAAKTQQAVNTVTEENSLGAPIGGVRHAVMETLPTVLGSAGGAAGAPLGPAGMGIGAASLGTAGRAMRDSYRKNNNIGHLNVEGDKNPPAPDIPRNPSDAQESFKRNAEGAVDLAVPVGMAKVAAPIVRSGLGYTPFANKVSAFMGGETPAAMMKRVTPSAGNLPPKTSAALMDAAKDVPNHPERQMLETGLDRFDAAAEGVKAGATAAKMRQRFPRLSQDSYGMAELERQAKSDLGEVMNDVHGAESSNRAYNYPMDYPENLVPPIAAANETVQQVKMGHRGAQKAIGKVMDAGADAAAMGTDTPAGMAEARQETDALRDFLPKPTKAPFARAAGVATGHVLGGWPLARAAEVAMTKPPAYGNAAMRKAFYGLAGHTMEAGGSVPARVAQDMSPVMTKEQANQVSQMLQFYPREKLNDEDHLKLRALYDQMNQ